MLRDAAAATQVLLRSGVQSPSLDCGSAQYSLPQTLKPATPVLPVGQKYWRHSFNSQLDRQVASRPARSEALAPFPSTGLWQAPGNGHCSPGCLVPGRCRIHQKRAPARRRRDPSWTRRQPRHHHRHPPRGHWIQKPAKAFGVLTHAAWHGAGRFGGHRDNAGEGKRRPQQALPAKATHRRRCCCTARLGCPNGCHHWFAVNVGIAAAVILAAALPKAPRFAEPGPWRDNYNTDSKQAVRAPTQAGGNQGKAGLLQQSAQMAQTAATRTQRMGP